MDQIVWTSTLKVLVPARALSCMWNMFDGIDAANVRVNQSGIDWICKPHPSFGSINQVCYIKLQISVI